MRIGALVVIETLALGAACARPRSDVNVRRDHALVDAATERAQATPSPARFTVVHGKVLDLDGRRAIHALAGLADGGTDLPRIEASDGDDGWTFGTDGILRGFELGTGRLRWSTSPGSACKALVHDPRSLFCVTDADVVVVDRRTGAVRRFATPAKTGAPSEAIAEATLIGPRLVLRRGGAMVEILDAGSGALEKTVALPFSVTGWRATLVAQEAGAGFCALATDPSLKLACFDPAGTLRFDRAFSLSKPTDPPSSAHFVVRQITAHHVVLSSLFFGSVKRALVVRLRDGVEVARAEEEVASVIEDEAGALDGLLVVQPEVRVVEATGKRRWSAGKLAGPDEGAAAMVKQGRVIAAIYPPISSGSRLLAFERETGKVLWKGDVELLPVAHSEYMNEVTLAMHGDDVLLRGVESSMSYLELFELGTGTRRFSDVRYTF